MNDTISSCLPQPHNKARKNVVKIKLTAVPFVRVITAVIVSVTPPKARYTAAIVACELPRPTRVGQKKNSFFLTLFHVLTKDCNIYIILFNTTIKDSNLGRIACFKQKYLCLHSAHGKYCICLALRGHIPRFVLPQSFCSGYGQRNRLQA